ncbi:hypothetical protein JYB64_17035, partial [Algoriphagus aestuarii]|nr:hypothetical protein [Algoriphagus aestuarii]
MAKRLLKSILIFLLILIGWDAYGQCPSPTTITTTGNNTWLVPSGVTSITVEVWGAGGAGGVASGNPSTGGGGSGGGYVRTTLTVTPGSSISYFVGQGGSGASGGNGQSSWFQNNSTVLAIGGNGAGSSTGVGTGAAGVTTGNIGGTLSSWYGGAGGNANSTTSGGGGASAGTSGNGNAANGTLGGTSSNGSFAGPDGTNSVTSGTNGFSPGSGGAGGKRSGGSSNNGGNGGNGQIRITINPSAVGAVSSNQTICSGSSPSNLTIASATGTIQWQRADNLSFTTNVTNLGTNSTTLTSAQIGTLTATRYFRAVVTNGSCPPVYSSIITVTVNPVASVTAMNTTICSGDAFSVTPANSTNGVVPAGTTYSWSAPAVTGGITGGAAGTGATAIAGTLTNPTNTAQTATYTVTPTSGSCPGTPFTVTVTVSPKPAVTNMTATVCSGDAFSVTPANSTNGVVPAGTTYSWSAPVVTGGITGGAAGTGATAIAGTLTNPTNTAQTATYTVTPTSGSCPGSPFTVTVTVSPKPAVTNMTATACSGDAFSVTPANSTNGVVPAGTTYSWSAPAVTGGITGGAAGT